MHVIKSGTKKGNKPGRGQDDQFFPRLLLMAFVLLPPFLFSLHIRFGQSQALHSLTNFILKNINIHNMKSIFSDAP